MKETLQKEYYNLAHFTCVNEQLAVYETRLGEDRRIITWSMARTKKRWKCKGRYTGKN